MPKVTYKNSKETIEVKNGTELRVVCQDNGWNVPFACEDGVCGTCIVKVSKGYKDLSPIQKKEEATLEGMGVNDGKHRLACQCKIHGDVTIET